ncbi:MAG: AIPR family protein [Armatimonadetes bacterium]|nr:AIPR family protein [Armatimonadota bacterium]
MSDIYTLDSFALDIQQQVISRCETEGEEQFQEAALSHIMIEHLSDAGELDDADVCTHRAHGLQVNGCAISENAECLDVLVTIHTGDVPPRTVGKDEVTTAIKRVRQFASKALNGYHHSVDESTRVFDVAQRIHEIRGSVTRIRFFLLTDGVVRTDPPKDADLAQTRVSYHIWDIERLYRCWSSGRRREAIEIDFLEATGAAVPCLPQLEHDASYNTYLAVLPGPAVVELYGRYGPRLLERNVRSFLQARGKINAGMRRTIRLQPEMFLAYNNGLSATAEEVRILDLPGGGKGISWVRDLQIVNGGQTTASIYHAAKKDKADVSRVFVQVKLTVLRDPDRMDEVVPLISEYANSQNKIQTADLAANDAYHRRIEELSRTIWAPARSGGLRQTRWYYERARGQYRDDLARERTPGRQREFQTVHPPTQQITKTDLAKFIWTWEQLPHVVSRGAQSCFNDFTTKLDKHIQCEGAVDTPYFERLVARAILFRTAERIMRECGYAGYRANLVTYTLARLAHDARGKIDLGRIWREQGISPVLEEAIRERSRYTWDHITNAPDNGNVTQYCKKESCWTSFLTRELPMPHGLHLELSAGRSRSSQGPGTAADADAADGSAQEVMAVSADAWFQLANWGCSSGHLTALQRKIASDLALLAGYGRRPSPRQVTEGLQLLRLASENGFRAT